MDKKLFDHLEKHKILFTEYKHPAVFTVEESKKLDRHIPGMHTKNLFLKSDKEDFFLAIVPAESRLSLAKIKLKLNLNKLKFASADELKSELNLTPGSVSLFGMLHSKNTILLIDPKVWESEFVGFHPNINTSTLSLPHPSLEQFCNSLKIKPHIFSLTENA